MTDWDKIALIATQVNMLWQESPEVDDSYGLITACEIIAAHKIREELKGI